MNRWKKLLCEERGVAPIPVIWIIICIIVGAVAGVAAYLVTQTCVTILVLVVFVALFAHVGVPLFPRLCRALKDAGSKLHDAVKDAAKTEKEKDDDGTKPAA